MTPVRPHATHRNHPRLAKVQRESEAPGKTAAGGEAVTPPLYPAAPLHFDDALRLDEEIRLLRAQVARKLQLQNAQLKTMLERFER